MDDIIFSSKSFEAINEAFESFSIALSKSRYEINKVKTQRPSMQLAVFNLELSTDHIKVAPARMIEFIKAYAKSDSEFEKEGIAAYVRSVNAKQAVRHFP